MKYLNINTLVEVQLTDFGLEIWKDYTLNTRLPKDSNKIRITFWELANCFGSYMTMGAPELPFINNTLKIEED